MKETISIKVTFTLEIKLQKYIFQDIMTIFLAVIVPFWNPC